MNIFESLQSAFSVENIFNFLASAVDKVFEVPVLGDYLAFVTSLISWMPFPIAFLFWHLYAFFMIRLLGKIVQLIFGVI